MLLTNIQETFVPANTQLHSLLRMMPATKPEGIPFEDFGGSGLSLHFAHANGYPPGAYRSLLGFLSSSFHVVTMRMRPLWPDADPLSIQDWEPLTTDLAVFLNQNNLQPVIGAGHSMGAIATLRLALRQPDRFSALALIDPVLFPPRIIRIWDLVFRLGLSNYLHPLVPRALRRRYRFTSAQSMFENYRSKPVFRYFDNRALWNYVDSLAQPASTGEVILDYPSAWEARIYVTGVRHDLDIWRRLPELKPPIIIIRGAETDTFWSSTAKRLQRVLPKAKIITIPDATHLVPLEKPEQVYQTMISFLDTTARIESEHP